MKIGDLCRMAFDTIREDRGDFVLIVGMKDYGDRTVYTYIHQRTGKRRQAAQRYLEKVS